MTTTEFAGWTIYKNPVDHPGKFVARRWLAGPGCEPRPTTEMFVADTLDEARALLPAGMICFARDPDDEPQIVECWM